MKNIVVTGVSRGLGLKITQILIQKGYTVYGISRTISEDLLALSKKYKKNLILMNFDLSNVSEISQKVSNNFIGLENKIYGFVNNAAIVYDDLISNLKLEPLQKMYSVNVFSPMLLTRSIIRNMIFHKTKGSIVHISSISAHTGYKGLAMYASTKGALESFSKNTAREWGSIGIRSNCVVAGFMETSMSSTLSLEQKERIYQRTSMKKPTSLDSVANTVAFLILDDSKSITGQNIFVDSGTI